MLEEIKFAEISLVSLKNNTPHCINHGAMNRLNDLENGSYWRCLSVVSKTNDTVCRAGCKFIN